LNPNDRHGTQKCSYVIHHAPVAAKGTTPIICQLMLKVNLSS